MSKSDKMADMKPTSPRQDDDLNDLLNEEESSQGERSSESSASTYTTSDGEEKRRATVYFKAETWNRIQAFIEEFPVDVKQSDAIDLLVCKGLDSQ
jgi:hypothetical protein